MFSLYLFLFSFLKFQAEDHIGFLRLFGIKIRLFKQFLQSLVLGSLVGVFAYQMTLKDNG